MSQRDLDDAYLTNALIDAHGDDPEFDALPTHRTWSAHERASRSPEKAQRAPAGKKLR